MLDSHLSDLYRVSTKRLNEQVRRNRNRFPEDFMFQLKQEEAVSLRSQFATLNEKGRGAHRKYLPYAFTGWLRHIPQSGRSVSTPTEGEAD